MKKILFITWDAPNANYLEGLFLPIFNEVSKHTDYSYTILQFTWATDKEKERVALLCNGKGVSIKFINVYRKPYVALGSLWTIVKNIVTVRRFVKTNDFDIIMPRSLMPAAVCLFLKSTGNKIIYDADGLPLLERMDFSSGTSFNITYQIMSWIEQQIVTRARVVLTRSDYAITYLSKKYGIPDVSKFHVVTNGRSESVFKYDDHHRNHIRLSLGIESDVTLIVYCGSLDGKKYLLDEMMEIFKRYQISNQRTHFLILTGAVDFAKSKIPENLIHLVTIKSLHPLEVPKYLSASDVALSIINPMESMKAASAVKLGEYFLIGLPIIATSGIGNSQQLLANNENCLVFDLNDKKRFDEAIAFIDNVDGSNIESQREIGLKFYSLNSAANSYITAFDAL